MASIEELAWADYWQLCPPRLFTDLIGDDLKIFKDKYQCQDCNSIQLVYDCTVDETICSICARVQPFNFSRKLMEYLPTTTSKIMQTEYRYIDYLNRKLDELSCARITVSAKVMSLVYRECKKPITKQKIRRILFKNGHKQKFLQIPTILNTMAPDQYPALRLNSHQRKRIEEMFCQYVAAFFQLKNRKRKNILNYHFILEKIFKILKIPIRDHYFNLPKSKSTLDSHIRIWKEICKINKW